MSLTLLLVGGAAITGTVACVMTGRSAIHSALAAERPAVGLGDPAADTITSQATTRTPHEWQLVTVDDLTAAEELLDCLENQGFAERELVVLGNARFAVRWR
jgi:hypothetical protein